MPTPPLRAGFPFKQKSILFRDSREERVSKFSKLLKLVETKVRSLFYVYCRARPTSPDDLSKYRIIRIQENSSQTDKWANLQIFFSRCPLVQSIRPPKIKAQLVFWPASLYFKTTFGLSKEATSSRLQRGGGATLHIYSLRNGISFESIVAKAHGITRRGKISGRG